MVNSRKAILNAILRSAMIAFLLACGKSDEASKTNPEVTEPSSSSSITDITGSITSVTSSPAEMAGWLVVLTDSEFRISRVAEVDQAGNFTLKQVIGERLYTLALLSPSFITRAVLAHPSDTTGKLYQYFQFNDSFLPRLVERGGVLDMQSLDGIEFTGQMANDSDNDGIPDGAAGFQLMGLGANDKSSGLDSDGDGILNEVDSDLDGDGIANYFDSDDDNDGILDVLDTDSNANAIVDTAERVSDHYFQEGVSWIAVKHEAIPDGQGGFTKHLTFLTQLRREGAMPLGVQIRGATYLLGGANALSRDSNGIVTTQSWDGLLLDDGKNDDASANDLLYARKIELDSGKTPRSNQVIFFQLTYGSVEAPWYKEYAYTFPPLTQAGISATYVSGGTIQLTGDPFGGAKDYKWYVSIYQVVSGKNISMYNSKAILGGETSFLLPDNIFEVGATYKFKATAQVLDRVPGYSSTAVESEFGDIPENR